MSKNHELMRALGYDDANQLKDAVKVGAGKKDGFLTWGEFLDFFFLGAASMRDRVDGNDWWNQLDNKGNFMTIKSKAENPDDGSDKENQMDNADPKAEAPS